MTSTDFKLVYYTLHKASQTQTGSRKRRSYLYKAANKLMRHKSVLNSELTFYAFSDVYERQMYEVGVLNSNASAM